MGMLEFGGMLIWDDYTDYKDDKANWERPTSAVDGYLVAYSQEFQEISRTKQLIVRKTADTPRCPVKGKDRLTPPQELCAILPGLALRATRPKPTTPATFSP
ncbi:MULTISPECIES: hypothetical protein [unclassified Mesorhizobium]|uniref:hypothetical protein n=1 Tax=unclassified Mesorhizobium TaxID=325217 RepID=UPI00333A3E3E